MAPIDSKSFYSYHTHAHTPTNTRTHITFHTHMYSTYVNTAPYDTCMRMGARVTYPKKVAWHIYET